MKSTKEQIAAALRKDPTAKFSDLAREFDVSRQYVHQVAIEYGIPRRRGPSFVKENKLEYQAWQGMIARCTNPNSGGWATYGGRGIRVCDRWRRSFQSFLSDMGKKPSAKHSLDRINTEGHYEPGNCRWATPKQQANNTKTRYEIVRGLRKLGYTLKEIEEVFGYEIPDALRDE